MRSGPAGALAPYRVVELAGENNQIAGFILATLGAEVVSVEPPGGLATRRLGPFIGDTPGPDRSLPHLAYGRGKKRVTLDLDDEAGRAGLRDLLGGADMFIEAAGPELAARGLGHGGLAAANPALVHVSMSGFGAGPDADGCVASDLAILAASGSLVLGGDPDRAPCRLSLPQAWLHTGAMAAGAGLLALYERNRSGIGQLVEVSAQQAATIAAGGWVLPASAHAPDAMRSGGAVSSGVGVRYVWPAADGFVSITHLFGPAFGSATRRLMESVYEAGLCDEAMRDIDWIDYGRQLHTGEASEADFALVRSAIEAFTSSRTEAELFDEAISRRLLLAPVNTVEDVRHSIQLADRDYWEQVEHPEVPGGLAYPGAWARFSATPLMPLDGPASAGAHTGEVLGAGREATVREAAREPAALDTAVRDAAARQIAAPQPDPVRPELPLSGVRVLDFTRSYAGPTVGRVLADMGATVVRVESSKALDPGRTVMPYLDNEPGVERSVLFSSLNAGKLGITLDTTRPEAQSVVRDLARWADVVMESFSPGVMARWGLGYDDLRAVNPGLIMMSTSLMGATGPLSGFAGYGNLAAALCGFTGLLGWPDRPPAGPFAAYTDFVSPHFMLVALVAALDHRRRTSQGQHIDLSQAECSLHFLTPALLDLAANGRVARRAGNDDPGAAPHGVYRTRGEDRWVALTVTDDAQWKALCGLMGRPELRGDLSIARERVAKRHVVDVAVQEWTERSTAEEIVDLVRGCGVSAGISAHVVATSADCLADPKLAALGHFAEVDHPVLGPHRIEGTRFRLTRTPGGPRRGGPLLNEHLSEVLHDLLGYDDDTVGELVATGIFE